MNLHQLRRPLHLRALVIGVVASLTITACGDDTAPRADSSSAITTAVAASEPSTDTTSPADPTTTSPTTTEPAATTTAAPTTAAPTTTEAPVGWAAVGAMPDLAYLPCCASNYVGDPSPPIPTDPAAALLPGIYRAFRDQPGAGEPVDPATITFELRPFVPCGVPEVSCEEPFVPGEVGVGPFGREVTTALTDDLRVVIGGFDCADEVSFTTEHLAGTGGLLAELQRDFDQAYASVLAGRPDLDDQLAVADDIAAQGGVGGFDVPGCPGAGTLVWRGATGPGILLQGLRAFDQVSFEPVVPASASIEFLRLTAFEVGADGTQTLYFYAGFLS